MINGLFFLKYEMKMNFYATAQRYQLFKKKKLKWMLLKACLFPDSLFIFSCVLKGQNLCYSHSIIR